MSSKDITPKEKINMQIEWNRRWSLSVACFIFAFLGVGLGTVTNRRAARSGSLVICISAIVVYWTFFVGFESVIRAGHMPASIGSWLTNIIFLAFSVWQYRRIATN